MWLRPDPDSDVTAITAPPPYYRTTYIYGYPELAGFTGSLKSQFWFILSGLRIYPDGWGMVGPALRLVWGYDMRGRTMYHNLQAPYVYNVLGGVLKAFALPVPFNA